MITSLEILEKERILKKVIEDIEIKNKELLSISSLVDLKKQEDGKLFIEIESKKNILSVLQNKISKKENDHSNISKKYYKFINDLSSLESRFSTLQINIKNQNEILKSNSEKITISNEEKNKSLEILNLSKKNLSNLLIKFEEMNKNLSMIQDTILSGKKEYKELLKEKVEINGDIENAIERFRLFESRIMQFSEETGYKIGYKMPSRKRLIANNK